MLPTPYFQDELTTLYHGDAVEILPELEAIRLIVTDPPYVFGIASTGQEGKAGGWGDLMNSAHFYAGLLREFRRLIVNAPNGGAAWVFNSWRSFPVLARAAYEAEWPIESLGIWDKQWIGPGGPRGLRPSYEQFALFVGPGFGLENRGLSDIWPCQWSSHKPSGHSAEKPEALVSKMIRESGGGTILDPFVGSGTTLAAARALGLPAIGIEIERKWCESTVDRLRQVQIGSLYEVIAQPTPGVLALESSSE